MQLSYYKCKEGNFGDDLNDWIWDALLPGWRDWDNDTTLIGIGTILTRQRLANLEKTRVLVLGSGAGRSESPKLPLPLSWDFRSVRGPRTAKRLGLPSERAVTDPAVMISEFPEFQNLPKGDKPAFIPHYRTVRRLDWNAACERAGMKYVSPSEESKTVIRSIASAPLVVAESMHAVIIADTFRVPWIPVRIMNRFDPEKWADWAESMNISIDIPPLFPTISLLDIEIAPRLRRIQDRAFGYIESGFVVSRLSGLLKVPPRLSELDVLQERKRQYRAVLDQVIADYG
ncbi:polysaccharide pyruvyl transferase family protein [Alkalilacustris brevis]|uniref:polysaccharide pyruvyl transferase family protein n=1 Tax=Alkalilacustris brevis TaxID=2026338 RepID=UPI000E0D3E96|nr:polysaccharide pyruvyl transferase family protein [Alkalilacustris brevis]